ncbi:hypothetical protein BKA59DRAFT_408657 [Fusarium tricinctum]|uniref:Nephrocystin 3-like N-terminal domain-containing protein n=1 Tax=Fusarium tricinctum TaxID=61284 RepID=A0A8K0RK10_9HYPO|nr:hypothetical protein BKA59DRAFT_408657 [Fusarium tricinctum]
MDPVTAVGMASAIMTFVDVGFKFIQIANEIHNSADGVLHANRRIEDISAEADQAATRLQSMAPFNATDEEESLFKAAQRCRKTSSELATTLNDLKPNQSSPKRLEIVKHTLKVMWKDGLIKKLEDQLKDDRHQLTLAMSIFSRAEAADGFKKLFLLAKTNETKLDNLTQALEHLRRAQLSMTDNEASSNFQELLTVGSRVRRAISQDRILDNIKFDEMCRRYEAVHVAYESTFNWIYEDLDTVQAGVSFSLPDVSSRIYNNDVSQMQSQSREMFINWLSSGSPSPPVFHISGKLGSGKSTLMKFLCCHPRTVQELNKWAGTNKLVFASFFSWRHGTNMQKSLAGLRRTLLYEVLKQRPDLLPDTLPDYWNKAEQTPGIAGINLDFPRALIEDAFSRLLQNPQLGEKHRFCFFIDGLDEFDPDCQDGKDYADMVGIFRNWTTHANGTLKLCVSSREECVFMKAYRNYPGFRLQCLTRIDMQNYVRSRLSSLKDETTRNKFIYLIPEKSSGIFLWTYLVVNTVRNKISHGVSDKALEKYLEALPENLKALFQHVLDNLEEDDKTRTLRTICLLQTANSKGLLFSLVASSLLDQYFKDPEFSMREEVDWPLKDQEVLRTELRGACGGLIESHGGFLQFVHRSVPEMFQGNIKTNELSSQMEEALKGMDVVNVLIHLCFAAVRTMPTAADRSDYIEWKIQQDPEFLSNALVRALVGLCLLRSKHWEVFFRNNVFLHDQTAPLRIPLERLPEGSMGDFKPLTAWQFFIVDTMCQKFGKLVPESFPQIVEQFLKYVTDPYCQFQIESVEKKDRILIWKVLFRDGVSDHCWTVLDHDVSPFSDWLQSAFDRCQVLRNKPRLDFLTKIKEEFSLRDIIAGTEWPNRDAILKLMDDFVRN